MNPRRILALALLSGLLCAAPASAQDREDPEPEVSDEGPENMYERLIAVSATGGLDTPWGVAGGSVEFAPIEWLNIYVGGGASRSGVRVAGGVNFRAPVDSTAFGLQIGVAGGPMEWDSHGDENLTTRRYWEFALFLHAGFNVEYRWDEGIFGRFMFGSEALIAGDVVECTAPDGSACATGRDDLLTPFRAWVGLQVGYAFEL